MFEKKRPAVPPSPPSPPTWPQIQEDLRQASASDIVFADMEDVAEGSSSGSDREEAVFSVCQQLHESDNKVAALVSQSQEQRRLLSESSSALAELLGQVKEKAHLALHADSSH